MRRFLLCFLLPLQCLHIASLAQTPLIINQPQSEQVSVGASVTLSVSATGSEPLLYQWYRNGIALAGMTKRTVAMNPASPRHTGTYKVVVRNTRGLVMSDLARIEVNDRNARSIPIPLTGWNEDVILENTTVPFASTNFDAQGNYWFESGLYGHADGPPAQNEFTSVVNTNVIFAFQPYAETTCCDSHSPIVP